MEGCVEGLKCFVAQLQGKRIRTGRRRKNATSQRRRSFHHRLHSTRKSPAVHRAFSFGVSGLLIQAPATAVDGLAFSVGELFHGFCNLELAKKVTAGAA